MKTSELIARLAEMLEEHGDAQVLVMNHWGGGDAVPCSGVRWGSGSETPNGVIVE